MQIRVLVSIALCLVTVAVFADSQQIPAYKITAPPTIDGTINEEEWKDVPAVEGLFDDQTGSPYSDPGRFWIAYDEKYVYFAARLTDSSPGSIRATEYRTNVGLSGDDWVEVDLDLSGSLSAFNRFQINPAGATNITIAGGRASKREWLGSFVAKSRITAGGWEAEARIPWSAMSVPGKGQRNLRVNFRRFVARTNRTFSYVYTQNGQNSALIPVWFGVQLPAPEVDHSIKLLPYVYAGYDERTGHVLNGGLDLKTALTDQINLVGTINPDFRNIENQILSIDFSRFERIAGESRPFFQEGSSYTGSALFASQRIQNFDVGLNTYGRLSDKTSFGFINTTDFGHQNATILNVTHDPDPTSSFRVSMTDLDRTGLSNQAYLLRYTKLIGSYAVTLRDLGSQDTHLGFGRYSDATVSYSQGGLGIAANYTSGEPEFNPRLAFFQEVDLKGPFIEIDYNRLYDKGSINDWGTSVYALSYDHADNTFYRKEASGSLYTTLRGGLAIVSSVDVADFEGSKDTLYTLTVGGPRGNPYKNLSARVDSGRLAGQSYRSYVLSGSYRMNKKLQLTLRHQTVEYGGRSNQTIFSANYDLGNDRSISGRAVSRDSDFNFYVAYRRSGNEGIEYFLILGDPNAPKYRNSLILKAVVPLRIAAGHKVDASARSVLSGAGASGSQ